MASPLVGGSPSAKVVRHGRVNAISQQTWASVSRRHIVARELSIIVEGVTNQVPALTASTAHTPLHVEANSPPCPNASPSRRIMCVAAAALAIAALRPQSAQAVDVATSPSMPADEFDDADYVATSSGYRVRVPKQWDRKGKAGADVLWEDPNRRSTAVGVTVNPVRVKSIEEFGTLDVVGEKLLDAERKKDGTLSVSMISQSSRQLPDSNALLYDFEYDLNSTRGRKRILNSVTIYNSKLFILNAAYKCEKGEAVGAACSSSPDSLEQLRRVASTFSVLPTS